MPITARTETHFWDRFWAKVDKTSTCWNWTGARTTAGYGSLRHQGITRYAHRVSYEHHHGPVPNGMCICHRCDNRACVNPAHFFLGTRGDNIHDAATKDRMQHGAARPSARLTDQLVHEIRDRYATTSVTQHQLAEEYGVSQTAISKIVRRTAWRRA